MCIPTPTPLSTQWFVGKWKFPWVIPFCFSISTATVHGLACVENIKNEYHELRDPEDLEFPDTRRFHLIRHGLAGGWQAIAWINVDPDLCRYVTSLEHFEMNIFPDKDSSDRVDD